MNRIPMNIHEQEQQEKSQLPLIISNPNTDAAFTGKIKRNYDSDEFPIGYKFCPQDDELIVHYLRNKIFNNPLPHNKIPSVNLYDFHPTKLTEAYKPLEENEWYFFTPRDRKYPNGSRPKRAAGDGEGYWKATGADKDIKYNGKDVGKKKSLVFYNGKPPKNQEGKLNSTKTNWIMHEYKIIDSPPCTRDETNKMRLDDWVLCKIHDKNNKRKFRVQEEVLTENAADEPIDEQISGDSDLVVENPVLNTNETVELAPLPQDYSYHYNHNHFFPRGSYHHHHLSPILYHDPHDYRPLGSYDGHNLPPPLPLDFITPYPNGTMHNNYQEIQAPPIFGGYVNPHHLPPFVHNQNQNEYDIDSSSLDNCMNESSSMVDNYINTSSDNQGAD